MRSDSSPRAAMNIHLTGWAGGASVSTSNDATAPTVVLVHRWVVTSCQNSAIDSRSRSTTRPPTSAMPGRGLRPVTWNIGHGAYTASSPDRVVRGIRPIVALSWPQGTMTPLAGPVVPDV